MLHDEPLVRLDGSEANLLSVSPVVNTKAYHDAFLAMPVSKPVAESAYTQAGRILQKAAGKDEEYLIAINARTGALVADNLERKGYGGSTTFIGEEVRKIQAHECEVVMMHNHPHSGRPSYQDLLTASRNQMIAGSIVLGHDGSIWFFSALSASIAARLESFYNQYKDSFGDKVEMYAVDRLIAEARRVGLTWKKLR